VTIDQVPRILFVVAMILAGAGWLILMLFPRRSWANLWLAGVVIPLVLGALYTVVMLVFWFQKPQGHISGFFSLPGLRSLFENSGLLLAAFIDLLVMPLLLGAWMARKAAQINMPYIYLLFCMILTIIFPATGFVMFVLITGLGNRWVEIAKFEGPPPAEITPIAVRTSAA
jgi:hypothetical protein